MRNSLLRCRRWRLRREEGLREHTQAPDPRQPPAYKQGPGTGVRTAPEPTLRPEGFRALAPELVSVVEALARVREEMDHQAAQTESADEACRPLRPVQ